MGVYDRQLDSAYRMLAKYGQQMTISTFNDTVPDPAQPWRTGTPVEVTETAMGVELYYERAEGTQSGQRKIRHETQHVNEKKVILSAKGLVQKITPKSVLTIQGEKWKIERSERFAPNGEVILYILQVKQ